MHDPVNVNVELQVGSLLSGQTVIVPQAVAWDAVHSDSFGKSDTGYGARIYIARLQLPGN